MFLDKFFVNEYWIYLMRTTLNLYFFFKKYPLALTAILYNFYRTSKFQEAAVTLPKAVLIADSLQASAVRMNNVFKLSL